MNSEFKVISFKLKLFLKNPLLLSTNNLRFKNIFAIHENKTGQGRKREVLVLVFHLREIGEVLFWRCISRTQHNNSL